MPNFGNWKCHERAMSNEDYIDPLLEAPELLRQLSDEAAVDHIPHYIHSEITELLF